MPAAPGDQQTLRPQEVFISYSRKDKDFVRRLDEALKSRSREAWVDWEDIRPTEEWMQAIYRAIEAADTFVFVLTPDSIASVVCGREIAHAAAGAQKDRQPTALQTEYIIASRKAAARRQRLTLGAVTFGFVVAIALAIVAWEKRTEAVRNANEAKRQETKAKTTSVQADFD